MNCSKWNIFVSIGVSISMNGTPNRWCRSVHLANTKIVSLDGLLSSPLWRGRSMKIFW